MDNLELKHKKLEINCVQKKIIGLINESGPK
jgi:hypothetical protein